MQLSAKTPAETDSNFSLTASIELSEDFVQFKKSTYGQNELSTLFESMNADGNAYCAMAAGKQRYKTSLAARFIIKERLKRYRRGCRMCINSMTAGCWNFFKMNDRHPEKDFLLVHKLFQQKAYSCYSVGFLQPYIMHNFMNCQRLTMLDIDWRILHGHYQFVNLFKQNQFTADAVLDTNLKKLKLGWVAHHERYYRANNPANMQILCKPRQRKFCRKHILNFQKNLSSVKRFKLNLAGLHDGDYREEGTSLMRVIYLSNAIEHIYTSKKQFNKLIKNLNYSLKPGENAVLIHHVGGRAQFGLYIFERLLSDYRVRTICKDLYENTAIGSKTRYYNSYFEKISASKRNIPRCKTLLKRFGRS